MVYTAQNAILSSAPKRRRSVLATVAVLHHSISSTRRYCLSEQCTITCAGCPCKRQRPRRLRGVASNLYHEEAQRSSAQPRCAQEKKAEYAPRLL